MLSPMIRLNATLGQWFRICGLERNYPPLNLSGGVIGFGSILVGSHLGENFSATACPQDKRYDQRQRGNGKKYGRNR